MKRLEDYYENSTSWQAAWDDTSREKAEIECMKEMLNDHAEQIDFIMENTEIVTARGDFTLKDLYDNQKTDEKPKT